MKFAWLTDIHLNFLDAEARARFYTSIVETPSDIILITGDIAEAPSTERLLKEMSEHITQPIYFVLGNHDYYRGEVAKVRETMAALTKAPNKLHWIPAISPIVIDEGVVLLGQDGWADGRYGNYVTSDVVLNDSHYIVDLNQKRMLGKYQLLEKMQELADTDAKQFQKNLAKTIERDHPKKAIILTHVPPFKEVCRYREALTDDDYLPFYANKAMGDVLLQAANENPRIQFLVLSGHTHEKCEYQALDNLVAKVGQAQYSHPQVQEVFVLS